MKNLILFFTRYYYFFLFLFLELLAFLILYQNNNYQQTKIVNASNQITGSVLESFSTVQEYFHLKATNDQLARENAALRNHMRTSFFILPEKENPVSDTAFKQKYKFLVAEVVNATSHKRNNFFTLNRGASSGIQSGMGVIAPSGVVGIVKDVSENFCTVMSVLHDKVAIPVIMPRYRETGILKWDGSDNRFGHVPNIPTHLDLKTRDTILTSPSSSIFPSGVLVGTIEEITQVQGNTFNNLKVRFSTDLKNLTHVYVVNYLFKSEQDNLESKSIYGQ